MTDTDYQTSTSTETDEASYYEENPFSLAELMVLHEKAQKQLGEDMENCFPSLITPKLGLPKIANCCYAGDKLFKWLKQLPEPSFPMIDRASNDFVESWNGIKVFHRPAVMFPFPTMGILYDSQGNVHVITEDVTLKNAFKHLDKLYEDFCKKLEQWRKSD